MVSHPPHWPITDQANSYCVHCVDSLLVRDIASVRSPMPRSRSSGHLRNTPRPESFNLTPCTQVVTSRVLRHTARQSPFLLGQHGIACSPRNDRLHVELLAARRTREPLFAVRKGIEFWSLSNAEPRRCKQSRDKILDAYISRDFNSLTYIAKTTTLILNNEKNSTTTSKN